ncbi:RNA polymerase sigma factor [Spirillospora sp. NPDC048911]|uniref:RNA polymerase sigma factor n=1 Tax=Spirillospora sp. NPDC048911 TaxID=3364527 RepID=UPI00371F9898
MNDEERFTALFRRHHTQVLAYALRRTDAARAEDVVAETFAAAWRHIGRLPEEPLPWLYRTAANRLANERRSSARQARVAGRVARQGEGVVADHAAGVAENAELMAALGELPVKDREALLLVSWEGLDQKSAAYALGCSVSAFKVRLHRARKKLAVREVQEGAR